LLELRAYSEGMRVLAYCTADMLDQSERAGDVQSKQRAGQLAALLTPIVKAFCTEQGFRLASSALQVFGGYGYINEYAIEQTLRDSRISMFYEDTNEIQANDLLLRKVLGEGCEGLQPLLAVLRDDAGQSAMDRRGTGTARLV
jgi:alkylation response protein AidB-like acyl-CoA dehydrogenase